MNERPLVSIVINNYNYGRFLGEAIDSALNQTYPHIEVTVVDDGSTDNSRAVIASYNEQIIPVLKENGGQASAFNAGFAASKGEIICILDSDDLFLPGKVADVVSIFRQHQDIGWCFHRLRFVDDKTGEIIPLSPQTSSRACDFRAQLKQGKLPFVAPATSGLCFARSLLQQILPMPEASGITISDSYLKFTALVLGKGYFLDEELGVVRLHGNNRFTVRDNNHNQQTRANITILTAYCLRTKWPVLAKLANKLFAQGLGIAWKNGGVAADAAPVVKSYLSLVSPLERLEISIRSFYRRFKI